MTEKYLAKFVGPAPFGLLDGCPDVIGVKWYSEGRLYWLMGLYKEGEPSLLRLAREWYLSMLQMNRCSRSWGWRLWYSAMKFSLPHRKIISDLREAEGAEGCDD